MSSKTDIQKLRAMLGSPPGSGECECGLSDGQLGSILERYPCYELAAYHACLLMAQNDGIRLADGTVMPDQSEYWLRLALTFRPCASGTVRRADEAGGAR